MGEVELSWARVFSTYVLGLVILVNNDVWLATTTADLDGNNLFSEPTTLLGGLGLLVAPDAVFVLVFPGEAVVGGTLLSGETHVLLCVCVGQTILEHTIDEGLVAELGTVAHVWEVVGGVGHGLGATSDDDIGGTSENGLCSNDDGLDTRGADLVDGRANGGFLETSADSALAGRVLSEAFEGQI